MLHHLNATSQKPARIVVVGAGGFVGSAIALRAESEGLPVLRIARDQIDLLQPEAFDLLRAQLRPADVLVAAAALAPCKTPDMLRDNMALAATIVKAAAAVSLGHVLNVSSDAVYADSAVPLTEQSVAAPASLHGAMHLAREIMFQSEIKVPLATIRPSLLYGATDPHNGYGPNRFRRQAAKGDPILLFGNGEERRDHVLIDDVAELTVRMILRRSSGALNIATGHVTSFRQIAEAVVRIAPNKVPIVSTERSGVMPHNGYRPFDIAGCRGAFPDFSYTRIEAGLLAAAREV